MIPAVLLLLLQQPAAEAAAKEGIRYLDTQVADPDLRLLALAKNGVRKEALQGLIGEILSKPPATVRSAALQASALTDLDAWSYRPRIAHCFQLLLDSQTASGFWAPGSAVADPQVPVPKPTIQTVPPDYVRLAPRAQAAGGGDVVNTTWAGYGLLAAERARIAFPLQVVQRAAVAWQAEGLDPVDVVAWRTAFDALCGEKRMYPAIDRAVYERLAAAPVPATPRDWFRLRLANLHAGFGGTWREDGIAALLASQKPDGSWGDVESTCCALLFLSPPIDPLAHRRR